MTISDHICSYLASKGYEYVFGLTGGGIARMFDSASRYLKPIYLLHEQSASMAAVAYSMLGDHKGLCFVTTGPGGTNALTGLLGAYQDSVPCLFFSGQSRSNQMSYNRCIRQGAVQDFHILSVVDSMVKYSKLLLNANDVEYVVDKAIDMSRTSRYGPSWIDIPIDVQWSERGMEQWKYTPPATEEFLLVGDMDKCRDAIAGAKRPVILAGYGCRLRGITDRVNAISKEYNIPVVTTWNTMDIMDSREDMYLGVVGTMGGRRGANMTMCDADVLIAIGTRLPVTVTGNLSNPFNPKSTIIVVNDDRNELKYRESVIDIPIIGDVSTFLDQVEFQPSSKSWIDTIGKYKLLNSVYIDHAPNNHYVNPFIWGDSISSMLSSEDTVVIDGGGTILSVAYNSLNLRGQRAINLTGIGCMGTGLPMAIGAHYATGGPVVVMCGDGSIMLNIHDLATIAAKQLPIKIFIMDNSGYLAIRNTQDIYFDSKYCGSDECGGLDLPVLEQVLQGFNIPTVVADSDYEAVQYSKSIMGSKYPWACILKVDPKQLIYPTPALATNDDGTTRQLPLYDMYPKHDAYKHIMRDPY